MCGRFFEPNNNSLRSPIESISYMTSLATVDLSHNLITGNITYIHTLHTLHTYIHMHIIIRFPYHYQINHVVCYDVY
jgi:hypothetical protein